jgi:hypothetical protein
MSRKIKDAEKLINKIEQDQNLINAVKNDPVTELKRIAGTLSVDAILPDTWVYRIVVISLGGVLVIVAGSVLTLSILETTAKLDVPDILTALGSGAIGALAGLIAPTPKEE